MKHDHRRVASGFFGNWAKHHARQNMTEAELREYRESMDFPMEELATTLHSLGYKVEHLSDPELAKVATAKLKMLHKIAATVMNEDLLKAVMAE